MAHIVVLGAGLGGMPMAYEMKEQLRPGDRVTVVGNGPNFHFVPSNPWVAVNWRKRKRHRVPGRALSREEGHRVRSRRGEARASRGEPASSSATARSLDYDYLVIATGPKLAFDEVEGLGPDGHTQSVCHVDHAERAAAAWDAFVQGPRPDRRRRRAGRLVLRAGLRVRVHHGHRPAPAQDPRPGADDVRDRRAVHRPPRPGRRRRLEGDARVGDARQAHQVDHQRQGDEGRGRARCTSPSTTRTASRRRSTSCRSSTR